MGTVLTFTNAQRDCSATAPPSDYNPLREYNTSMRTNSSGEKIIRVMVHFPLKTDGTGNFTETTNCYGANSPYTGYWFADKFIEVANERLNNNIEMSQQLSYRSIPVEPIKLQFNLSGVMFHRDSPLFNSRSISKMAGFVDANYRDVAIHAFVYPDGYGSGATFLDYDVMWSNGSIQGYEDFLANGNTGFGNGYVATAVHEIGHCLELLHPKRTNGGNCCTNDASSCLDDCDDTPTYLELLLDGYTNPCTFYGNGYSNNVMDYNPIAQAWTPCQINIVHNNIANGREILYPCYFLNNTANITSNISTENKSYLAKTVTTSNIVLGQNRALYVDCETFETTGVTFETEKGAVLEIDAAIKCN